MEHYHLTLKMAHVLIRHMLSKHQSLTTVLFRTPITQMIIFKVCSPWVQTILLLGLLFMYLKGLELGGHFLTFIASISRQK